MASEPSPIPVVPDHEMLRVIGRGAYGEVWLARTVMGVYRAVKVVQRAALGNEHAYDREFRGLRHYEPVSRTHAGLVQVLHAGRDDAEGFFYYVMELADDARGASSFTPDSYQPRTLTSDLKRGGPLPVKECVTLGLALTEALAHLHGEKLVHRDVKPSNVIFVQGKPKLADVGLIAAQGDNLSVVGTPGFIAPEGPGQPPADIFSLGKVLVVASTGKNPADFPALSLDAGTAPSEAWLELNEVLLRACADRCSDRYKNAAEMHHDLEWLDRGRSLRGWGSLRRALRPVLTAASPSPLIAFALIATLAAAWFVEWNHRPGNRVGATATNSPVSASAQYGRIIFEDNFDGELPNENLWEHHGTHTNSSRLDRGQSDYQISQSAGSLLLECRAEHQDGFYRRQDAWLDSKVDLKEAGETDVEIEFSGSAANGAFWILITDGKRPEKDNFHGEVMVRSTGSSSQHPVTMTVRKLRATLVPSANLALVYKGDVGVNIQAVLDVSKLTRWLLRFHVVANSSEGFPPDDVKLLVHRMSVRCVPERTRVVATVRDAVSHQSVPDAEIQSRSGKSLARANDLGIALLDAAPGTLGLVAKANGYGIASGPVEVTLAKGKYASVDLWLKKSQLGPGDVVESIPLPAEFRELVSPFVFADQLTYFIAWQNGITHLFRLDRQSFAVNHIAPLKMERGLAWHRGKLYGVEAWDESWLFEVSTNGTAQRLHKLPTPWPVGLASDGELLWFIEGDGQKNDFGFFAVNPENGAVVHHFKTANRSLV